MNQDPDGIPHDIIGRTAYVSLLLALVELAMLAIFDWPITVLLGVLTVPVVALLLSRRSARERASDDARPSSETSDGEAPASDPPA